MRQADALLCPGLVLRGGKGFTFATSADTMVTLDVECEHCTSALDVARVALDLGQHHGLVVELISCRGEVILLQRGIDVGEVLHLWTPFGDRQSWMEAVSGVLLLLASDLSLYPESCSVVSLEGPALVLRLYAHSGTDAQAPHPKMGCRKVLLQVPDASRSTQGSSQSEGK